eukprot:3680366-Karenia_brevis.AAC.1
MKFNAWGICAGCNILVPRKLTPSSLQQTLDPQVLPRDCFNCRASRCYTVPKPGDVPAVLRGLSCDAQAALSMFDIDSGSYYRENWGYQMHTAMMRFSWHPVSVRDRIRSLPEPAMAQQALAAYQFLKHLEQSAYNIFLAMHSDFLRKHGRHAEEYKRKLFARFIEEQGIECGLWPCVFWDINLCLTVERATNPDRRDWGHDTLE